MIIKPEHKRFGTRISQIQQQGSICHNQQVAYRPYKEVTVHWAHGNAVINHTFCVFWWLIFQFPRSPVSCPYFGRHWRPAPNINHASNVSSVKTDFRYKRSFLSIAGAKVQQFGVENKFLGYSFLGVFASVWLIMLYNDILEINCCTLTDFEENEGLWLRILESGHFRSWSFSVKIIFGGARSFYIII